VKQLVDAVGQFGVGRTVQLRHPLLIDRNVPLNNVDNIDLRGTCLGTGLFGFATGEH
jgi:hypothetical protein